MRSGESGYFVTLPGTTGRVVGISPIRPNSHNSSQHSGHPLVPCRRPSLEPCRRFWQCVAVGRSSLISAPAKSLRVVDLGRRNRWVLRQPGRSIPGAWPGDCPGMLILEFARATELALGTGIHDLQAAVF